MPRRTTRKHPRDQLSLAARAWFLEVIRMDCPQVLATTKNVQGWVGVLMTEHSSFPWRSKRRRVYPKRSG